MTPRREASSPQEHEKQSLASPPDLAAPGHAHTIFPLYAHRQLVLSGRSLAVVNPNMSIIRTDAVLLEQIFDLLVYQAVKVCSGPVEAEESGRLNC